MEIDDLTVVCDFGFLTCAGAGKSGMSPSTLLRTGFDKLRMSGILWGRCGDAPAFFF